MAQRGQTPLSILHLREHLREWVGSWLPGELRSEGLGCTQMWTVVSGTVGYWSRLGLQLVTTGSVSILAHVCPATWFCDLQGDAHCPRAWYPAQASAPAPASASTSVPGCLLLFLTTLLLGHVFFVCAMEGHDVIGNFLVCFTL